MPEASGKLKVEMKELETKLYVHSLRDWYSVPKHHVKFIARAGHLLKQYPTVEALVRAAYPEHIWDHAQFSVKTGPGSLFAPQFLLLRILRTIFPPKFKIDVNARAVHGMVGATGLPLEIDVFFPELNLGFEYQDPHHYFHTNYGKVGLTEYQERDRIKKGYALKKGITLVSVPFWWDWNPKSLVATVRQMRPELLSDYDTHGVSPLTDDPPPHIINKFNYEIPGIGVLMLATDTPSNRSFAPYGWWVCEKYDGMRAAWVPKERIFYSRWGNPLPIIASIADTITPLSFLDGEIWFGRERGMRYHATKLASSERHLILWSKFQYMVFDSPQNNLRDEPYPTRYNHLRDIIPPDHNYVKLVPYDICSGRDQIEDIFFKIRTLGGEGIILRDPAAGYLPGYSQFLYKHKGFRDAEALILKKVSDNTFLCRVHKFSVKAKLPTPEKVESSDDTTEKTTEALEETEELEETEDNESSLSSSSSSSSPLSSKTKNDFYELEMTLDDKHFDGNIKEITEGTFVSFKYLGENAGFGLPQNPKIYTIRSDVQSWDQILRSKRKPLEHKKIWGLEIVSDWKEISSRKTFFDEFAADNHFDPRVAENWSSITNEQILSKKGGHGILYHSTLKNALLEIYPDIGLELKNFKLAPKKYWNDKNNCREFLENLALVNQFDPLVAKNWYSISVKDFLGAGGGGLLQQYGGSVAKVILDIYGFIGLEPHKFNSKSLDISKEVRKRKFFDEYAADNHFDPLVPGNWYNVTYIDLQKAKAGNLIRESMTSALLQAYPSIGLQPNHFKTFPRNYWAKNTKQFFDEYANKRGFDPLVSNHWYSVSPSTVEREKGGEGVFAKYKGSMIDALRSVYPSVVFEDHLFDYVHKAKRAVKNTEKDKQVLERIAKKKGFDVKDVSAWNQLNNRDIENEKGGPSLLKRYWGNFLKAVADIYPDIGIEWKSRSK